jgi:excinuclease ABC subunit C
MFLFYVKKQGKKQLSLAVQVLKEMNLNGKIAIIGLAKRLEKVFFPKDTNQYYLNKKSETLKLLQNLRNEAHKFGITFHRQKRSKSFIVSELDTITQIGDKTKQILFENFKTVENFKKQSLENLSEVVGNEKAKILVDYFKIF